MQIIERKNGLPRNGLLRERRRRIWPGMLIVAAILAAVSRLFGPSAALMTAGIGGAVAAFGVSPSARRALWSRSPVTRQVFFLMWFAVTLAFCFSFITSGTSSHRAAAEARATITALGLCAVWFAARRTSRAGGAFTFAVTVALAEVARLLALGMRPQPVSYFVWFAAAIVAWRTVRRHCGGIY